MLDFIKGLFGKAEKAYEDLHNEAFAAKLKSTSKAMLLDVRHKHEFDQEKMPNAINMDVMMPNFAEKMKHYDKDKSYFVYCQSGRRSAKACNTLAKMGFQNLVNLKGGINQFTGKTV
mgnify:CR=1 FL=1